MKLPVIEFYSIDVTLPVFLTDRTKSWIDSIIRDKGKRTGEVFFLFCTDKFLLELNKKFLNHDTFTDILTFPDSENPDLLNGEIYISLERVWENAKKFSQDKESELHRVMIHGILHLLGYEDGTDKDTRIMRTEEDDALKKLNNHLKIR